MGSDNVALDFPHWLNVTHFVNFLFISLLVRSGIQILMDHPRLYLNDHCVRGGEWLKFTKRMVPTDRPYTAREEMSHINSWIGLPGSTPDKKYSFGIGRHWHLFSVIFWVTNGFVYLTCLFPTNNYHRLIPRSWDIFPRAWGAFIDLLHFQIPDQSAFHPYNPLQQLSYAFVIFILAPLAMISGACLSPAVSARFPFLPKLFGGRQRARSVHFLVLVGFLLFFICHIALVYASGFDVNITHIALGLKRETPFIAHLVALTGILVVVGVHVFVTKWSNRNPRKVQNRVGMFANNIFRFLLGGLKSRQNYSENDISEYHWINGYPPKTEKWLNLLENNFSDYKLEVKGMVENPLSLSLTEIKEMPYTEQITVHYCIQGWSGCAKWGGLPLTEIIKRCKPLPTARYAVFRSHQHTDDQDEFYTTLELSETQYPQTILAYKMNGKDLPVEHGAPLRLRMESKVGYKMIKWIESIEFIDSFENIGQGQGGYREDVQYFCPGAQI